MECHIQSSAECIHLSSVIYIGSSGIFALFLVLFTKFPVPLWSVMYILDCFILCLWGNELFFEGIFKGILSRPTTVYCSSDATMMYLRWR